MDSGRHPKFLLKTLGFVKLNSNHLSDNFYYKSLQLEPEEYWPHSQLDNTVETVYRVSGCRVNPDIGYVTSGTNGYSIREVGYRVNPKIG